MQMAMSFEYEPQSDLEKPLMKIHASIRSIFQSHCPSILVRGEVDGEKIWFTYQSKNMPTKHENKNEQK